MDLAGREERARIVQDHRRHGGKFAGISGGHRNVAHVNEFRTAVEGTYAVYTTNEGSYKLP
jgi:hypothetical protein